MRLGMVLMCAMALVSIDLVGTAESYQQNRENRDKARATRGFKNSALSTARGFGKRDGTNDKRFTREGQELLSAKGYGKRDENTDFISLSEPQYLERDSFPADWFADELQNNEELARLVVNKFIDTNQDGELTTDELLRPTYLDKSASMYK